MSAIRSHFARLSALFRAYGLHARAAYPMDSISNAAFGTRLRKERERRRITLTSIAANTKINIALLHGLEAGDVARWPSGIFRRSFIRAYATAIGLDAEEVAREFLERFPDPSDPIPAPAPAPVDQPPVPAVGAHFVTTTLRLKLVDATSTFVRGPIVSDIWRRWAAAGWDVGAVLVMGALLFLGLRDFWMSVATATLAYYASSIIVLGNTPGVTLFAAARRAHVSESDADKESNGPMRAFTRSAGF
jgi:transcriptional regulator with XRE-family HTH domain